MTKESAKHSEAHFQLANAADMEKQKQAIESLSEERDLRERFVATLTHDLRTPLTAARINTEFLQSLLKSSALELKLTKKIIHDLDRIDRMIRDLLDVTRIRAGESLPLRASLCDLDIIIRMTLGELKCIYGERLLYQSQGSAVGFWDSDGMRRILENLCNNAIKYGENDKPVEVSLSSDLNVTTLKVHNQGRGLTPEEQAGLFQHFQRTKSAQASGKKGWGIGLTLVKGLVEAHEGKISIDSKNKEGTTIQIVLPLKNRCLIPHLAA